VGVEIQSPEFVSIGDSSWIDRNALIIAGPLSEGNRTINRIQNEDYQGDRGHLAIGRGCHICPNTIIQAHEGVYIGDFVAIASGGKVYSVSQHYRDHTRQLQQSMSLSSVAPPSKQILIAGAIVMDESSAVGMNSIVLPGSTIGAGSWVGTLSCVRGKIPPNSVASGCPAIYKSKDETN
ncbi:MAG: hypothetical protein RTU92_05180, partial [Candidatus Thorarchaeota archaeon]